MDLYYIYNPFPAILNTPRKRDPITDRSNTKPGGVFWGAWKILGEWDFNNLKTWMQPIGREIGRKKELGDVQAVQVVICKNRHDFRE